LTRVQILLSEDEDRQLEELAAARRESKSSLVRRAVDLLLRLEADQGEPLLALVGQAGRSGTRRAARNHDRILTDAQRQRAAKRSAG
jgi:Arc/MetJ-type ribon-helix-helix transcriptional regulator